MVLKFNGQIDGLSQPNNQQSIEYFDQNTFGFDPYLSLTYSTHRVNCNLSKLIRLFNFSIVKQNTGKIVNLITSMDAFVTKSLIR